MAEERDVWNASRFVPGAGTGHYESWFQRANHPARPLAFWIRYTIFEPAGRPDEAQGELWAVYFDGEARSLSAVKREFPMERCRFSRTGLTVSLGEATLDERSLQGEVAAEGQAIAWELRYESPAPPLLVYPRALYGAPLPRAKALVGSPGAVYTGALTVGGERVAVEDWVGSQNHNWGSRHTDRYAWGQVAGFDGEAGSFLEVATARLKVGPVWTPPMTVMVLRLDGREHRLSSVGQSLRATGSYDTFHWSFASATDEVSVSGTIAGSEDAFVGLPYRNPPGGTKTCLNSKIARCDLTVRVAGGPARVLTSRHRAAFEILTDARELPVPVLSVLDHAGGIGRGRFAG